MSYQLYVNGAEVNLFPDQEINISFDYYDTQNPESVRVPFSFEDKFPHTEFNKAIFGYDDVLGYGNAPTEEYSYEAYVNNTLVSAGTAKFVSAIINSSEPYITVEFSDKVSVFSKQLKDLKFSDLYNDTFSTTERTLYNYLTGEQDYSNRDIEIPFIDVDDIQKRDGFPSRQFTAWGITNKKVGLMPALKVQSFISRIFSVLGFDLSSKFVDGNSSWTSDDLYMLYPTSLSSSSADTRISYLFPFPYNVDHNLDQTTLDPIEVVVGGFTKYVNLGNIENYKLTVRDTYEPFGPTNYNPEEADIDYTYGYQHRTSTGVTDYGDERIGYVSYANEFTAKVAFSNGTNNAVFSGLKYTILSSEYDIDGIIVPTAVQIFTTSLANAKFTPYLDVYAGFVTSSSPTYRIPLLNSSGNEISISPSSASFATLGGIDYPTNFIDLPSGIEPFRNTLEFPSFTGYIDETKDYPLLGGTRYSYAISMVMTSGNLVVNHKSTTYGNGGVKESYTIAGGADLYAKDIMKSRVHGYSWFDLGVKLNNHSRVTATSINDKFSFQDSFNNNTSISAYDVFVDLLKRFNLSIMYDYRPGYDSFIVDNINDIRTADVLIDQYIDNLKEFEVSVSESAPKILTLSNKEFDGLYDVFENGLSVGSYKGEYDVNGKTDYEVSFISGLINPIDKSVRAKDDAFNDSILVRDGLISIQESGQIKGEIQDFEKIGLRLFYLKQSPTKTVVRYPKWQRYNSFGQLSDQIYYKVLADVKLQGYPFNGDETHMDLRFATRNGSKLDAYYYLIESDKFLAAYNTKFVFYAAFPVLYFNNGFFFNKVMKIGSTGEKMIIVSFSDAKLYDDYVYGKVEAIFVN